MMSWMAGDFFRTSPALAYAVLALGIQMSVFCAVSLRTLLSSRDELSDRAQMPLKDEEPSHE